MKRIQQRIFFILSLVCLISFSSNAQEICQDQVILLIKDKKSKSPIPAASVGVGQQMSLSDMDGFCSFQSVCAGALHIHVLAIGYETIDKDVVVANMDTLTIYLNEERQSLDDVEITGHKQALTTTASSATLNQKDLNQVSGKSLANALEGINGVSMLQTGATISKPVIDGMYSNRILILNNGVKQEGQQWGVEHAPEIDPFIAQSVTVVKGAGAVRYGGDAIGGIVLVNPAPLPNDSTLHGSFQAVGISNGKMGAASGMLSGNSKKWQAWSWRIQGTAKKSGNMKTPNYFLENTGMNELNYSAALGYHKEHFESEIYYSHFNTELGIFKESEIGSVEDLKKHIDYGRPYQNGEFSYSISAPKQIVAHDLLKAKSHIHLNDYLHLNLQYAFQSDARKEYDIRRGGRSSIPSMDLNLKDHDLQVSVDYFDGLKWKGELGVAANYQENKNIPGTFTTPLIPDYIAQNLGAFAIANYFLPQGQLEAGIRYDYKYLSALGYDRDQHLYGGVRNFNNFSGSLGAKWDFTSHWHINTNVGSAWRSPSVNELYSNGLHSGAASFELGDSTLKSETAVKWITTVNYDRNWFQGSIDVFAHYFDHYIYLNPSGQFVESLQGVFPAFQYAQTNARFLGINLQLQATILEHFVYKFKGSVLGAKDLDQDQFLPMIPANRLEQSIQYNFPNYSGWKNTIFQIGHSFVGKQSRYNPLSDYAAPPPSYHLFKFAIGTDLVLHNQEFNIHFSIQNLFNTEYKDYMNRFRYYAHDLGRSIELRIAYHF